MIKITKQEEANEQCDKAVFKKIETQLQIATENFDLLIKDKVLDNQIFRLDLVKNILHNSIAFEYSIKLKKKKKKKKKNFAKQWTNIYKK